MINIQASDNLVVPPHEEMANKTGQGKQNLNAAAGGKPDVKNTDCLPELGEQDIANRDQALSDLDATLQGDVAHHGHDNINQLESMLASSGKDLAASVMELTKKNEELIGVVATLRDDVAQREHDIKNLESILASNGDDLAAKVEELTKENSKLQEFAQAQQVNEYDTIIKKLQDKMEKLREENDKFRQETQEMFQGLESEKKNLSKQVVELTKKCAELEKKCDNSSNLTVSMDQAQLSENNATIITAQVQENEELIGLVETLQDDVAQCEHNIKNLESIVASNGDDLAVKVEELTKENSKLQEFAQAQQARVNDTVIKKLQDEMEKMREENDKFRQETQEMFQGLESEKKNLSKQVVELPKKCAELEKKCDNSSDLTISMDQAQLSENNATIITAQVQKNEELIGLVATLQDDVAQGEDNIKKLTAGVQELSKENMKLQEFALAQQEKIQELEREKENLTKRVTELSVEVMEANENKKKVEANLVKTRKERDVFFGHLMKLYPEQKKSSEEISALKRSDENLRAQLSESKITTTMLQDEKEKIEKMLKDEEKCVQEMQKAKRELEREKENLTKSVTELSVEVMEANENKKKVEANLVKTRKERDVFFDHVMRLYPEQKKSSEEISALKRSDENLRAQLSENKTWTMILEEHVSAINEIKKDRESMAKVLQEIEREKENLLEQVTQLTVEVIEANEIGRNDKAQLLETAKNFENLCAAVSEKEDMINSQHQVIMELRNELTRANECVEETAENQENLRVLVSEKQDMIGMLQDQNALLSKELDELKNMPSPIQEQEGQVETER